MNKTNIISDITILHEANIILIVLVSNSPLILASKNPKDNISFCTLDTLI